MTHQSWDLLSNLLYGRPGQRLPDYVARRAGEIDVYLRDDGTHYKTTGDSDPEKRAEIIRAFNDLY